MDQIINRIVERLNQWMERHPGLLPLVGVVLVLANLLLKVVPGTGNWLVDSDLLLHVGVVVSVVGVLLISVYRH